MQKTVYEDYKYSMQDTGTLYVGAKYTFQDLLDEETIAFKFRLVMERYILPEADPEDTLETHLYYLDPKSFLVKIYKQMKAKVKVNVLEEKKPLFGLGGSPKKVYTTKVMTVEQLAQIPVPEKERMGLVVQEISVSKMALASF